MLERFQLDPAQRTGNLSKGQRTQVALVAAVCPETDLLVLDEPTSGLDPIVRREFIEAVIGAYQQGIPGKRTILVSTHLITEFEGLIDEFTLIDRGRAVLTLDADQARERYQKIRARFAQAPPEIDLKAALRVRRDGRELELIANGSGAELMERLRQHNPEALSTESLTLEEIFVATLKGAVAADDSMARRNGRVCSSGQSLRALDDECVGSTTRKLGTARVGSQAAAVRAPSVRHQRRRRA